MRRRATNPSSDPWDSFFYNAYSLTKPTRYEPVNQRQQMSLKTSVRRKLSTTPTPTPILGDHECQVVEGSNTDASSSLSSTSNIVVHDETVESGAVRVSATTSPSPGRSPPGLRPPTPPSSGGGVRRLSRSRERRLHIQLQSRDVGHDGQVVETIEIVHYGGNDRLKSSGRSDFDAFVDHLVNQPHNPAHLRSSGAKSNGMVGRGKKPQREINNMIGRLAYTSVPRSNTYRDPLTLDKVVRRNEQKARRAPMRIRAKSELPRWNIQRPTHSPDGKPPLLPRLTWLPFINIMTQQERPSSSPSSSRRVTFY